MRQFPVDEFNKRARNFASDFLFSEHITSELQVPASLAIMRKEWPPRVDNATSPSQESVLDPAPTQHAPCTIGQRVRERNHATGYGRDKGNDIAEVKFKYDPYYIK